MHRAYVVDFEGNGASPPDIVELALLEIHKWESVGRSHYWLLRPQQPITRMVTRIHGITDDDVAACPAFSDVEVDLHRLLEHSILIGHNVSTDVRALKRKLGGWTPIRVLDTLRLAKRLRPGMPSYSLHKLGSELNLRLPVGPGRFGRPHSAHYDVAITAQLFLALLNEFRALGLEQLLQLATVPQEASQPLLL